jgi:predicted GNAT family acetyltransferase
MTDRNTAALQPVEREDGPHGGRYVIRLDDGLEAEMTYRRPAPGIIAIDHTFVPPSHRGQGLAERLVDAGIADARAEANRVQPYCSYVAAQFRRHPEWSDLLAR